MKKLPDILDPFTPAMLEYAVLRLYAQRTIPDDRLVSLLSSSAAFTATIMGMVNQFDEPATQQDKIAYVCAVMLDGMRLGLLLAQEPVQ